MRRVSDESLLSWLRERTDEVNLTGLDVPGWPAETWILNAMYERPDLRADLTRDDVYRLRLTRRDHPEVAIDDRDVDDLFDLWQQDYDWRARPGPEWSRVRWTELASRLRLTLGHPEVPPAQPWFAGIPFPARLQGPEEGSIDVVSLDGLVRCLAEHENLGLHAPCVALYSPVGANEYDEIVLFEGPLSALSTLVDPSQGRYSTPNNIWAKDRSWFVFTDVDLWATKVSGPESLIDRLRADPDLEALDWSPE
jgi:hypothetical protein